MVVQVSHRVYPKIQAKNYIWPISSRYTGNIKRLCAYKGVEIIEGYMMIDRVHMLASIPPKLSAAQFMGYLKGKSALMIFDKHANLKYKFGNRHFLVRRVLCQYGRSK